MSLLRFEAAKINPWAKKKKRKKFLRSQEIYKTIHSRFKNTSARDFHTNEEISDYECVSQNKITHTHAHTRARTQLTVALILTLLNKHAASLCQEAEIQAHPCQFGLKMLPWCPVHKD